MSLQSHAACAIAIAGFGLSCLVSGVNGNLFYDAIGFHALIPIAVPPVRRLLNRGGT